MYFIILTVFIFCFIIYKIVLFCFVIDFANILSIISIFVDILMPLLIAKYLQNKFLIHRSLKSYHINLSEQILLDYKHFIDELLKGQYNRREITNKFKVFSIRFNSLDKSNIKRFGLSVNLQDSNRKIQMLVTNSNDFNNSNTSSKVKLSNSILNKIYIEYEKLLETNGDLIFELNK